MEMPIINRISELEAGINSLQNPSFLSQFLSLSFKTISHASSLWKWGALILALLASFSTIINRIKILIVRYQTRIVSASQPLLSELECCSEEDASSSSSSCWNSSETEDDDEEEVGVSPSTFQDRAPRGDNEVFVLKGSINTQREVQSSKLRRRRSFCDHLSGLCDGTNVVKLWNNLGFEIGLDRGAPSSVPEDYPASAQKMRSFFAGESRVQPVAPLSLTAVVSAEMRSPGNVAVRVWDERADRRKPVIVAEWSPPGTGKVSSVRWGGVEKLFLEDGRGELTVGDMRNVSSPVKKVTEPDAETWWDADAVIVAADLVDKSGSEWF